MSTVNSEHGGGEPPLTAQEQRLVRDALPMVRCEARWVVQRCLRWGRVQVEELLGPGTIAASEAARAFRWDMHTPFEHYARAHVRGRMLDAVRTDYFPIRARVEYAMDRAEAAVSEHLTVDADICWDEEEKIERAARAACDDMVTAVFAAGLWEAAHSDPESDAGALEEYRHAFVVFGHALEALPPEQREVVTRHHRDRQSLEQISVELGIQYRTAKRRHRAALQNVHNLMLKSGVDHAPDLVDTHERVSHWYVGPPDPAE